MRIRLITIFFFCISSFLRSQSTKDSASGFNRAQITEIANNLKLIDDEKSFFIESHERQYIEQKFGIKSNYKEPKPDLSVMSGTNIDFELGNYNGWAVSTYSRIGIGSTVPNNLSAVYFGPNGKGVVVGSGTDPVAGFSLTSPLGGNFVLKLGDNTLVGSRAYIIRTTINVTTTENLLKFAYANVFESSGHDCKDEPYLAVRLVDSIGNVLFNYFTIAPETSLPTNYFCGGYNTAVYTPTNSGTRNYFANNWVSKCVDLSPYMGRNIVFEVASSECSQTGHRGYSYFDAALSTCPNSGTPNFLSISTNTYSLYSDHIFVSNLPCTTGSLTVSAPAWPTNFEWNGPPTSGLITYTNQSFSTDQWGLYTLSMASGTSCPIVKTISITPSPPPTLTITSPAIVCYGKNTSFYATGADDYLWSDGSIASGITISSLTTSVTYSVIGTNHKTGCTATASITLNPLPSPTISISGPINACTNTPVTLNAGGAMTYTWSNSVKAPSITVNSSTANTFTYTVIGTATNGCFSSSPVYTVSWDNSLSVTSWPATITACPNTTYSMYAYGATNYTWSTGATTSVITSVAANTVFVVSSTNACGTSSSSIIMNVVNQPTVNVSGTGTVCIGSNNFTCSGAQNYYWMGPTGNVYTGSSANISPSYTGNITYTIIGTDANYCQDTITYPMFVNPSATFAVSPSSVCVGTSNTLTASGTPTSYTWQANQNWWGPPIGSPIINTNSVVNTPTGPVYYTITGIDLSGCKTTTNQTFNPAPTTISITANTTTVCIGSWATLVASGANSYSWSTGSNSPTITVTPTTSTTYSLFGTNACGTFTNSIFINYNPVNTMQVVINGTNSACAYVPYTFTATGSANYSWNLSGSGNTCTIGMSGTTTLTAMAKDINGCVSTDTKIITCSVIPTPTISGTYSVCTGQSSTLTANGSAPFLWSTAATTNSIVVSPLIATTYSLWGTDLSGCKSPSAATFTLYPYPSPTTGITPTNTIVCNGGFVGLDSAPGYNSYLWSTSSTASSIAVPVTTSNNTFAVTVINSLGCSKTSTISINTYSNPVLFSQPTMTLCEGSTPVSVLKTPSGGTLTGAFITDTLFNPVVSGNYTIYYYHSLCNFLGTSTITVLPQPAVSFSPTSNASCIGSANINLMGSPPGGVFSGTNVIGNQFQPIMAGQNCVYYDYTDANGCKNYDQQCFFVDLCTGINNQTIQHVFSVVPNPASGEITVSIDKLSEDLSIGIYNTLGQIIIQKNITDTKTKINLSEQANGIYFVRISEANKPVYYQKIIKE
jgi:hypothetical protein